MSATVATMTRCCRVCMCPSFTTATTSFARRGLWGQQMFDPIDDPDLDDMLLSQDDEYFNTWFNEQYAKTLEIEYEAWAHEQYLASLDRMTNVRQ